MYENAAPLPFKEKENKKPANSCHDISVYQII
jgi:hypothetical protein